MRPGRAGFGGGPLAVAGEDREGPGRDLVLGGGVPASKLRHDIGSTRRTHHDQNGM